MEQHDYSDHVAAPGQEEFARLNDACDRLHQTNQEIARLEIELAAAKRMQVDVAEREMPEIMDGMGLAEFTTTSGLKIQIKESVHASISKARHARAMTWLDENGHGALIKRRVEVAFDRTQQGDADLLLEELESRFSGGISSTLKVEPSTLRAFVREQLEQGAPIDQELFGVYVRKVAKID